MTPQNRMTPQDRMVQTADNARVMLSSKDFDAPIVLHNILISLNDFVSREEAAVLLADRQENWYEKLVDVTSTALQAVDSDLRDASACAAFYLSGVLQWKVDNPNQSDCSAVIQHILQHAQFCQMISQAVAYTGK